MEDVLGFLFFLVVFIIGPLLEKRRKGQQGPPQKRGPGRVERPLPSPRDPERSRTEEMSRRETEPQREPVSAADMVPDDLWEILTGQKRPVPAPVPSPSSRYEEEEPDEEVEAVEVWTEEIRPRPAEVVQVEARSLESYERHEVPVVVSLETLPPPTRERHAAFHRRLAQSEVEPKRAPQAAAARLSAIARRGTLRDVIVLQEVLGRPKGLE